MNSPEEARLRKSIRYYILFFIFAIVLSGLTTFPLESELRLLHENVNSLPSFLRDWITQVYFAIKDTNEKYYFLAYGYDWLGFAHLVIAICFIGPLKDPLKNIWVVQWGMIACLCVFPLALIAGAIRGVPMYWRLIDCSFGLVGFILLYLCYKKILKLEKILALKH